MKKSKVLVSLIGFSLISSTLLPYFASAEGSQMSVEDSTAVHSNNHNLTISHSTFESEGKTYDMVVKETETGVTTTFKSDQGTQTFVKDNNDDYITVSSDYLTEDQTKEIEASANDIKNQLEKQSSQEDIVLPNNSFSSDVDSPNNIRPMSQKGSWAWSSWQNRTVTVGNKVTVTAIAAAITSAIPRVGNIASALATIIIQYNMKTGYFKYRAGTRLDTDPNWVWVKSQVKVYKDKARKKLLKSGTSRAQKISAF